MPAIELTIFEDEPDQLGENLEITTEGEFVVIRMQIWEEGLGSFELAKLKIHHSVAKVLCAKGLEIRQALRKAKEEE